MKCHHCSRDVKPWQTFCPSCGGRLQTKSYSTIAETPATLEQQSRRRLLRQTLQFALLAATVILLASVIRLSPPQANPLSKESVRPPATPSPVPTPEPVVGETPPVVATAANPEVNLLPVDLFGNVIAGRAVPAVPRPRVAAAGNTTVAPGVDSVPPQKAIKPVVVPQPAAPETKPAPAEAKSVAPSRAEGPSPNLELEAGQSLLPPNTGLVTIKSYVAARVYIDGVYSGVTPRSVKLLTGQYNISLLAEGYHDYTRTVNVSGQQQIGILASMSKK